MGEARRVGPREYPGVVGALVVVLAVLLPGGLAFSVYRYFNPLAVAAPVPAAVARSAEPRPGESGRRSGSPIDAADYGDWNFRMDGVTFKAEKAGGWTYGSCAPVDGRPGVLAKGRCERAVQLAYTAYRGHLAAVQVIMVFPTAKAAKDAAGRLAGSSGAVKWRRDQVLDTYVYGKRRVSSTGRYVVLTVVTADRTARAKAARFHHYLHADLSSSFLFRDPIASG
ncbi:hypothetical protein [Nonomuraea sp. NPDC050783]|uniref:hypothetical protein n=1 Tax=Nonomuraea sp. NPDC050783 TaxID=3154634 RepID=UPI003465777D